MSHPAPTIDLGLVLVTQKMVHSAVGHTAIITYAVNNSGGKSPQQIADALQVEFNEQWLGAIDSNVTLLPPEIAEGDGSNVPAIAIASGGSATCTNAFVSPSPQIATLFKKVTGLGGKKNRGRIYFPWLTPANEIDEAGTIAPSFVSAFQGAATTWLGELLTDQSLAMHIANKTLATDPVTHKPYVTHIGMGPIVNSLVVESSVATQRRRLVRS